MANTFPTVDETIQTLKRSNIPTLITEGRDDYIVFRRLEDHLVGGVSVLPVGGRDNVIQLFHRRAEVGHDRIAFVVDRDLWSFTAVPNELRDARVIVTNGYSIENDVFRDADVPALMSNEERVRFLMELQQVNRWYALAVSRILNGIDCRLDVHPNELLDTPGRFNDLTALSPGEEYPEPLFDSVIGNPDKLLRGKTLFAVSMRQLNRIGRAARHHHHQIMDQAAARGGPLLNDIAAKVERVLVPGP